MIDTIHSCMTKAVVGDGDQLECGPQWITSRRARLKLFDSHLECGDWSIPYDQIREAVLSSFNSPILRIPGYILAVRTDSKTYHFGLNGGQYWRGELSICSFTTTSSTEVVCNQLNRKDYSSWRTNVLDLAEIRIECVNTLPNSSDNNTLHTEPRGFWNLCRSPRPGEPSPSPIENMTTEANPYQTPNSTQVLVDEHPATHYGRISDSLPGYGLAARIPISNLAPWLLLLNVVNRLGPTRTSSASNAR